MRRATAVSLAAAACFLLAAAIHRTHEALLAQRAAWPSVDERVVVPPPRFARILSLAYNELAADLAWVRTLVYYGDGMYKGSSLRDVDRLLELVNAFDPHFRRPYRWGGYATTHRTGQATQEEFRASIAVLERGLRAFPNDWELLWILGLRYAYDLRSDDPAEKRRFLETGAGYLERAMRAPGAPDDLAVQAASMRTRLGQRERAIQELTEMLLSTENPRARKRLGERLAALTSRDESEALAAAARELEAAHQRTMPYVPIGLYVLLGEPPPPALDPRELAAVETVALGEELDTKAHEDEIRAGVPTQ